MACIPHSQIYRLHDAAINALVVTDGICVTGSEILTVMTEILSWWPKYWP